MVEMVKKPVNMRIEMKIDFPIDKSFSLLIMTILLWRKPRVFLETVAKIIDVIVAYLIGNFIDLIIAKL
jgi:hypothetical protein